MDYTYEQDMNTMNNIENNRLCVQVKYDTEIDWYPIPNGMDLTIQRWYIRNGVFWINERIWRTKPHTFAFTDNDGEIIETCFGDDYAYIGGENRVVSIIKTIDVVNVDVDFDVEYVDVEIIVDFNNQVWEHDNIINMDNVPQEHLWNYPPIN
jgi:hypothetical protein